MTWDIKFKESNISIHIVATGAGSAIQQIMWEVPGCSAYLSGANFPYATEETTELLGFKPKSFCSEDTAIDLASVAYMKAFRLGGKRPVGLGVTATVASATEHRGTNRFHVCVMTNSQVRLFSQTLDKGVGAIVRQNHDEIVSRESFNMLVNTVWAEEGSPISDEYVDVRARALARFMEHPFFTDNGKRLESLPTTSKFGLMSGAFNPPHEGHLGAAESFIDTVGKRIAFEVTVSPPHKLPLTVQDLLQRAKMLQGHNVIFTSGLPLYLDKAKAFPGAALVLGADAVIRMLDPKWGVDLLPLLKEFKELGTRFYVIGRIVNNKFVTADDIVKNLPDELSKYGYLFNHLDGRWDISSTELRNKLK